MDTNQIEIELFNDLYRTCGNTITVFAKELTRLGYRKMKSPEEILELIDNYAETRHTCGHWTYNLKSNESRQKVIAALKGEA